MPATRRVTRTQVVRTTTGGTSDPRLWLWAVMLACLALVLIIIALVTSGWAGQSLLKNCGRSCVVSVVLCCLAIVFLVLGIITMVLFGTRLLTSFSSGMRLCSSIILTVAGVLMVSTYMNVLVYRRNNYSFYLMVTSSILTFVSSNIIAFWVGQHWVAL